MRSYKVEAIERVLAYDLLCMSCSHQCDNGDSSYLAHSI